MTPHHVTTGLLALRAIEQQRPTHRRRELEWRTENAPLLKERFAGRWLVVEGQRIVAAADTPGEAVTMARRSGVTVPYVFQVPKPQENVSHLGL